jgi:hypothetical protein
MHGMTAMLFCLRLLRRPRPGNGSRLLPRRFASYVFPREETAEFPNTCPVSA